MTTILEEAAMLTAGDRMAQYGHPSDHFDDVAAVWSTLISRRTGVSVTLEAETVALLMAALKLVREAHRHGRDNLVDGSGYLRLIEVLRCPKIALVDTTGERPVRAEAREQQLP